MRCSWIRHNDVWLAVNALKRPENPAMYQSIISRHSSGRYTSIDPLTHLIGTRASSQHRWTLTPYTWAEKFESLERINSIQETNGNFNSCNSAIYMYVNGWFSAVYMVYTNKNFRLFLVSNLSVLNLRIFLLMYPGSVTPWRSLRRLPPFASRPARHAQSRTCEDHPHAWRVLIRARRVISWMVLCRRALQFGWMG